MNLELLIKGGTIIDGTGQKAYIGDIRCREGKIVEIAPALTPHRGHVIDAAGKIVCPGFIDAHCHTDMYARDYRNVRGKIMQGVTTDVSGLCGDSPAPIGAGHLEDFRVRREYQIPGMQMLQEQSFLSYKEEINSTGNATNMALFVGNTNLRVHAVGYSSRAASAAEMEQMKGLLRESMEAGAYGLSSGLTYTPSKFATQDELTELCKVIAPMDGIYNSHMRSEGDYVTQAIEEVIAICKKSGCRGHISHLKVSGVRNRGRVKECLDIIHKAVDDGIPISFDVHPYTAGAFGLRTLLPSELLERGIEGDYQALREQNTFAYLKERLQENDWDNTILNCGAENIVISSMNSADKQYEGKTLRQVADIMQVDVPEALIRLLGSCCGQGSIIFFALYEEDLVRFMGDPLCSIGSDAFARDYVGPTAAGKPHPRNYGAFPYFIQKFLLDEKVLTLEEGIRRMTGLTAAQFSIPKRGLLQCGYQADITIFDPSTVCACGTFEDPAKAPVGVDYVILSGQLAVAHGQYQNMLAGRVL